MTKIKVLITCLALVLAISQAFAKAENLYPQFSNSTQRPEFRGIWIATINNIDWPSKPNLSVEAQKKEFIKLLDSFEKYNLNAVILQVRAASDAFYKSKTEPWSFFLNGKQGREPFPFYDPLAWAIEECHKRGMELIAWFNPFRVRNIGFYTLDPKSFSAKHPEYIREYDKKLFLDPGYPEVRTHVVEVIAEVARNYQVDGILLDDYFYPYPVQGIRFNDEKSYAKYGKTSHPGKLKDWRRENLNLFISSLHDTLSKINPNLRFGISPFGIWRNIGSDSNGSTGAKGTSCYDDLYADVRKWLSENWINFVIPQLYWENGNHFGDFSSLIQWWSENCFGKALYIGQALYKSTQVKNKWINADELSDQIKKLRQTDNVNGFAFYSASNLLQLSHYQKYDLSINLLSSKVKIRKETERSQTMEENSVNRVQEITLDKELEGDSAKRIFDQKIFDLSENKNFQSETFYNLPTSVSKSNEFINLNAETNANQGKNFYAFVAFKNTSHSNYEATILSVSSLPQFSMSFEQRKLFKNQLVAILSKSSDSNFFALSTIYKVKRRKLKTAEFSSHAILIPAKK